MAEDKKKKVVNIPQNEEEKQKFIDEAIKNITKVYGQGSVMKLGDNEIVPIEVIPTECLTLDVALGIGGMPRGRIVEIYGPESSGKTTVALHVIASAQKRGGTCAFIDAEHAIDPIYAEKLGVVLKDLYISQPDSGEQALDICEQLVRSGSMDVIVIDSVAALTPKAEIEAAMGDSVVGLQARLMSQALRKLTGIVNKTKTCVIFINQLREKVGVMYGSPEITAGGKALKFYASVRIDVRKGEAIKDAGSEISGNKTKAKVVKNKLAPPLKTAEFEIIYGKGISKLGCLVEVAVNENIVVKSGSWFSYNGEKIGQGKDRVVEFLEENPDMEKEIYNLVMEKLHKPAEKDKDKAAKDKASKDKAEKTVEKK